MTVDRPASVEGADAGVLGVEALSVMLVALQMAAGAEVAGGASLICVLA